MINISYIHDNYMMYKFTYGKHVAFYEKIEPACVFCGESRNIESFKGKNICPACVKSLARYDRDAP